MTLKSLFTGIALTLATATTAQAAVIMNIWEDGSDVRVSASGTLDLTGITTTFATRGSAFLTGTSFVLGAEEPERFLSYSYEIPSNPSNFGGVRFTRATSSAGSRFGLTTGDVANGRTILRLADTYRSGDSLAMTAFFENRTIFGMRLTEGSFVFALPSADTVTINVGTAPSAVPVPASAMLLLGGLGAFGALRARRSRARHKG